MHSSKARNPQRFGGFRRLGLGLTLALLGGLASAATAPTPAQAAVTPTFPVSVPLAVVNDYPTGIQVAFALGSDAQIYTSQEVGASTDSWTPWRTMGAGSFISPPVAVNNGSGIWVFAIGGDHMVYRNYRHDSDSNWSGWASIGSGWLGGTLSVTYQSAYVVTVVGLGSDNQAYYNRQSVNSATDSWTGWQGLGGWFVSTPSVIYASPRWLQVFGVSTDHKVYRDRQVSPGSDAWTGWVSIGDGWLGGTVAVTSSNEKIYVFGVGSDQGIYVNEETSVDGDGYTGWQGLGGTDASGEPLAAHWNKNGALEAFYLGADGLIYRDQQSGAGWSGWASIGSGVLTTPPAVGWNGDSKLEVLAVGTDNHVYGSRQTTPGAASWTGWKREACSYIWTAGTTFGPGDTYRTCGGDQLSFQTDGQVTYTTPQGAIGWTAGVAAPGGHLQFTATGNLVLTNSANQQVWATNTSGSMLYFAPDGNLMVLDSNYNPIWQTNTGDLPPNATLIAAVGRATTGTQTAADMDVILSVPDVASLVPDPLAWDFIGDGPFWDTWPYTIDGGDCGNAFSSSPLPACDTCEMMSCAPGVGSPSAAFLSDTATMEEDGNNVFGATIFKWLHTVNYKFNGDKVQITSTSDTYLKFPILGWADGGLTTNVVDTTLSSTPTSSEKQRKVQLCLAKIGCVAERYPWSKITVRPAGGADGVGGIG